MYCPSVWNYIRWKQYQTVLTHIIYYTAIMSKSGGCQARYHSYKPITSQIEQGSRQKVTNLTNQNAENLQTNQSWQRWYETDRRKRTKLKQHTPRRQTLTNQDSRISGLSTDWPVTIQTWPKRTNEESGRIRTDQSAAAAAPTTLHIPVHVFASTNVKSRVTLNYFCMYFSLFLRVLKDEIKKKKRKIQINFKSWDLRLILSFFFVFLLFLGLTSGLKKQVSLLDAVTCSHSCLGLLSEFRRELCSMSLEMYMQQNIKVSAPISLKILRVSLKKQQLIAVLHQKRLFIVFWESWHYYTLWVFWLFLNSLDVSEPSLP